MPQETRSNKAQTNPPSPPLSSPALNSQAMAWVNTYNELSYKLFYENPLGQQWLSHLEARYFREPVLLLGKEESLGWHREGRNALLREIRNAALTFMNAKPKSGAPVKATRTRKVKDE